MTLYCIPLSYAYVLDPLIKRTLNGHVTTDKTFHWSLHASRSSHKSSLAIGCQQSAIRDVLYKTKPAIIIAVTELLIIQNTVSPVQRKKYYTSQLLVIR